MIHPQHVDKEWRALTLSHPIASSRMGSLGMGTETGKVSGQIPKSFLILLEGFCPLDPISLVLPL